MSDLIKNLKLFLPYYECTLPVSNKVVSYTTFTVKDAKNINLVLQENNKTTALKALLEIIKNCCKEFNYEELCLADAEYLFLAIRAKSVEENLNVIVNGQKVSLNLYDVKARNEFSKTTVRISKDVIFELETPTIKDLIALKELTNESIISAAIKKVTLNNEVYHVNKFLPSELKDMIENLPIGVYKQIEKIKHPELFIEIKDGETESEVSGPLSFFIYR
jgi:hypothetical protein